MNNGKMTKIPVVVCEFHQEVIQYIHRYIARKKLPFDGIKMVHLDSHPDLAFPHDLKADDCFNKEVLYDNLDIADWILPLMYAGHLKHLTWLHPPWANQIKDGVHTTFHVGKDKSTGQLRLSCTEDYFLEDCMYTTEAQLQNSKDVNLRVSTLETLTKEYGDQEPSPVVDERERSIHEPQSKRIKTVGEVERFCLPMNGDRYVLDIDLDFFSVMNPFLQDYTEEEYKELKEIYHIKLPTDKRDEVELMNFVKTSQSKLESLKKTIDRFADGQNEAEDDQRLILLLKKIKERKRKETEIEWNLIHSAGMTTELPHHISDQDEIDKLLKSFEWLIKSMPRPSLITIARSAIDEYCPPVQVDTIEQRVLELLKNVYENIDVHFDYQDESRVL